ncbi:MAG TPA: ArgE/DapE family deacylase [Candidatus Bathyarchaeia archaeon]
MIDVESDAVGRLDYGYTLRMLEEMVRINSVVGEEGELAHYIQAELDSLGLETELHEVHPGRPNVYAKMGGSESGKRLHFNGHLDTVPVVEGWETDPFTPVVKNDRLYGLGSCDMKAGLACTLNMLRAVADSGAEFRGELSFSGVIDEEAMGDGAKELLKTEYGGVDAAVLAEPYPGDESKPIPLGIVGKILYDIHVHGKAAHGFRPEDGVNAVEEAGTILANLNKLRLGEHHKFGRGNYSTLKIEGGYERYSVVVPAKCRFEVNRLLVPGETVEGAVADMEELVASLGLRSRVVVGTKPPVYESFEMDPKEPILKLFHGVYRQVMGREPVYQYSKSITDANTLAGVGGIPCLHLGPRRGNTHQANEYVPLDWLKPVSEMYTRLALRYLS